MNMTHFDDIPLKYGDFPQLRSKYNRNGPNLEQGSATATAQVSMSLAAKIPGKFVFEGSIFGVIKHGWETIQFDPTDFWWIFLVDINATLIMITV